MFGVADEITSGSTLARLYDGDVFFVVGFDMTARNISSQTRNAAMTSVDPSDSMQSPPMSEFVRTSQRCVVARCTPIQSTSSDVTLCSSSTGKCQVVMRKLAAAVVARVKTPLGGSC